MPKEKVISIQKTRNFYYFLEVNFKNLNNILHPKKIDFKKFNKKDLTIIIPKELKNDQIFSKINIKKLKYVEFNLKNIDILIENNLLENKLIKPLYLS